LKSLSKLMNLAGRRALVVGGAGYIGRTAASTLAEMGATISILDLPLAIQEQNSTVSQIGGGNVAFIDCDLNDEKSTRAAAQTVLETMGGLDILVHCAAHGGAVDDSGWIAPFESQTVSAWDNALRVNLTSAFVLAQEFQQAMAVSGNGSIILFSSIYGLVGPDWGLYRETEMANPIGYGASKGGLLQVMRYLTTELAPNVRVNAISPGGVWRDQPELFHDRYKARVPLGRMATEEDLKGAVAYLASDLSAYVTGHNLVVDGGWTTW
jgi:NAD(P)-dependent dehydrogenase (short-subunit alcohol dehydrogenase family)